MTPSADPAPDPATDPSTDLATLPRTLLGGVLMGLANLVPGISGGTMILAVGLYDRFIGAVADVTRLRPTRANLTFLAVLGLGLVAAIATFSGPAVALVNHHRWVAYSLFVGLTLGGVPKLACLSRPLGPGAVTGVLVGAGVMAALSWKLAGTHLPQTLPVLVGVGALAASSMILPGISGSYVLLILGMYDLVIGSLSVGVLREDPAGAARVIGPVVLGAVLGIGLLSNLLKWVLSRFRSASHGLLLGLLVGSVFGLWPFQEPVHSDLADKRLRRATQMVLDGADGDAVRAKHGDDLADARLQALGQRWAGRSPADLKALGEELQTFRPGGGRIAGALGLLTLGFLLTGALGRRDP